MKREEKFSSAGGASDQRRRGTKHLAPSHPPTYDGGRAEDQKHEPRNHNPTETHPRLEDEAKNSPRGREGRESTCSLPSGTTFFLASLPRRK